MERIEIEPYMQQLRASLRASELQTEIGCHMAVILKDFDGKRLTPGPLRLIEARFEALGWDFSFHEREEYAENGKVFTLKVWKSAKLEYESCYNLDIHTDETKKLNFASLDFPDYAKNSQLLREKIEAFPQFAVENNRLAAEFEAKEAAFKASLPYCLKHTF